jgi:phosphodiesterase/alkaline phosphatase D-like protein
MLISALLASFLVFSPTIETGPAEATTFAGVCNGTAQANISVTPSHGKVMYIDTGQGQNINASYVGYKVTTTGSFSDVWVELDGFENDIVQLANPADQYMQLGEINTSSKVAYFLLRADRPTTTAQTHNVRVFNGNPEAAGNTELYSCTFSFQKVRETIKAAANKVSSVTSNSVSAIGDELIVTHRGITGIIGAGSSPDLDMIWISPASNAAWPTRALKLTNVQVIYYSNRTFNGNALTKTDELLLSPARNAIVSGPSNNLRFDDPKSYQATYTFKVIGQGKATIAPVAQISSGTQIKHTDMSGFYNTNGTAKFPVDTTNTVINATTTKTGEGFSTSGTSAVLRYSVSIQNTGSTAITIDDVVDTASSALTYRTGSAKTGTPFPGSTAVKDAFASPYRNPDGTVDSSKQNWTFVGPFTIAGNSTLQLNYEMLTACTNSTSAYDNVAIARIGDTQIGTTASSVQKVATNLVATESGGSCTVDQEASGQTATVVTLATEATALPATGITTSSATVNGRVDSNGVAGQTISCEISTDASMAGAQTVATSSPADGLTTSSTSPIEVSCVPTDLEPGTTYHYRIKVVGNDGTVYSSILSFTTAPLTFDSPTAVTNSPSNFSTSSGSVNVTFNSTVNPRGNVTRVRYQYATSTDATCTSLGTTTTLTTLDFDDNDAATLNLVLSGGFESQVSFDVTGLANNTTYCYRVVADYPFDAAATPQFANTLNGAWVSFVASDTNPPTALTEPATSITNTSATLNGTVTKGTNNANISFCLSSTASTTGVLRDCISGLANPSPTSVSSGTVNPTLNATGLSASTVYYFQVIATDTTPDPDTVVYANIETFTTTGPPIATTNAATNVAATTATINGNVSANGSETTVYFCFVADVDGEEDADSDGYLDHCITSGSFNSNKVSPSVNTTIAAGLSASKSANLTGLTSQTTYKFQVLAESANGPAKGEILTFTTTVQALVPTVVTDNATNVAGTTVTLNGSITAGNATTTSGFCYGTASDLTGCTQISASPGSVTGNSSTPISANVINLTRGTLYYFRASGVNSAGSSVGVIRSFTTTVDPATAQTEVPTPVGVTTATLQGSVTAGTYAISNVTFCLSTSGDTVANTIGSCSAGTLGSVSDGSISAGSNGTPSVEVTGLSPDTDYYVQIQVTSATSGAVVNGQVRLFRTSLILGTATSSSASSITTSEATLNGSITAGTYGGNVKFCYSTSATAPGGVMSACSDVSNLISASTGSTVSGSGSDSPTLALTGLTFGTTYYFQVVLEPSTGDRVYGSVLNFTTLVTPPTATTDAASSVGTTGATLNATVAGGSRSSVVSFCLSTSGNVAGNTIGTCGAGTQGFVTGSNLSANAASTTAEVSVSSLSPATTYYFRVIVTPSSGSAVNGSVLSFTTNAVSATATTASASSITQTSATLNSTVNAGTYGVTVKFCFNTSSAATAGVMDACSSDSALETASSGSSVAGSGTATSSLGKTGLSPATTYHFQVVAIPSTGNKVYGSILNFTTSALGAGATTTPATSITSSSATLNGSVSSGSNEVTVNICIATSGNTSNNTIGTCLSGLVGTPSPATLPVNQTSTAASAAATGLNPSTTYYFRVSVRPTSGSDVLGDVLSFTTAANQQGGGGGAGGGGGSSTQASPTPSPSPRPSPTVTRTPRPTNPNARPNPPVANRPTPVPFTPGAVASPQATQSPAPGRPSDVTPNQQRPTVPDAGAPAPLQVRPSLPGLVPLTSPNGNQNGNGLGNSNANPDNNSGGGNGSSATAQPPLVATSPTASTIDLGAGVTSAQPPFNFSVESTKQQGQRTISELAGERLGGFSPSSGLRIEVLGARTSARFVVSSVTGIDDLALVAALNASRDREVTNFSELTEFSVGSRPLISRPWDDDVREGINEFFAAAGLAAPKSLVDLDLSAVETWVNVVGSVETYVPGSIVFLITTSEPVVIGTAEVDQFGRAVVSGVIPVEALGAGAHSVRVVGTRSLDGITVDGNGEIQLSAEVMQEIQRFDGGTQATVALSGLNPEGGYHTALRVVPLDLTIYWWTLWFIPLAFVVVAAGRYFRKLRTKKARLVGAGAILASAIPGVIAGWLQSTTWLLVAALLLGAAGSAVSWLVKEKKQQAKRKK